MSRRNANTTKVFVGSLPTGVTADDLRNLFGPYGTIVECDIANRCGFLHLEDRELAEKAIADLNNTNFMGGRISVEKGRVKPPKRTRDGGLFKGGNRDRGGPYSRNNGYFRGPPRNGMGGYGNRDFGDRYGGDYDRGMPPRSYGSEYDDPIGMRRPPYDDQEGFIDDRRPYGPPNGYERRPYDDRPPYPDDRSGFDNRRMPLSSGAPIPDSYDNRRPLISDRRPLLDQGSAPRSSIGGYDRSSSGNEMFSRRSDPILKAGLPPAGSNYGDRDSSMTNYGNSGMSAGSYNAMDSSYNAGSPGMGGGYGSGSTGGGYGSSASYGYNDSRNSTDYGGNSGGPTSGGGYGSGDASGYGSPSLSYGNSYGGSSRGGGSYDSMYAMPQQRGFASGTGGSGQRRDMGTGPGRRY